MKIVPYAVAGPGAPQTVEVTTYDWKWYYSVLRLAIWLVLILALVLPKSNHDRRVLLIFIPLVIVNLLWLTLKEVSGIPSSVESTYDTDTMFHSTVVGIAVLWLVANTFQRFAGFVRFLLSFGTMLIIASFGTLSCSTDFSNATALILTVFVFLSIVIPGAAIGARKLCKGQFHPLLLLWSAPGILVGSLLAMCGVLIVSIMFSGSGEPGLIESILMVVQWGLLMGLCLYLFNLPFMILGYVSPFFRERLCGCLNLKTPRTAALFDVDSFYER